MRWIPSGMSGWEINIYGKIVSQSTLKVLINWINIKVVYCRHFCQLSIIFKTKLISLEENMIFWGMHLNDDAIHTVFNYFTLILVTDQTPYSKTHKWCKDEHNNT